MKEVSRSEFVQSARVVSPNADHWNHAAMQIVWPMWAFTLIVIGPPLGFIGTCLMMAMTIHPAMLCTAPAYVFIIIPLVEQLTVKLAWFMPVPGDHQLALDYGEATGPLLEP